MDCADFAAKISVLGIRLRKMKMPLHTAPAATLARGLVFAFAVFVLHLLSLKERSRVLEGLEGLAPHLHGHPPVPTRRIESVTLRIESVTRQAESVTRQNESATLQNESATLQNESVSLQIESVSVETESVSRKTESVSRKTESVSRKTESVTLSSQMLPTPPTCPHSPDRLNHTVWDM
eukprot:973395-Rhodomonas_salina.1